jgi:hypothetical protein
MSGDLVFTVVLVVHVLAVVGMVVAAGLQLTVAPAGPLKIFKWVWLPTVGGAAVTGLLLWGLAALVAETEDPLKMGVKVAALLVGSAIAARYHAAERVDTPPWAIPTMATVVAAEVVLSFVWS